MERGVVESARSSRDGILRRAIVLIAATPLAATLFAATCVGTEDGKSRVCTYAGCGRVQRDSCGANCTTWDEERVVCEEFHEKTSTRCAELLSAELEYRRTCERHCRRFGPDGTVCVEWSETAPNTCVDADQTGTICCVGRGESCALSSPHGLGSPCECENSSRSGTELIAGNVCRAD